MQFQGPGAAYLADFAGAKRQIAHRPQRFRHLWSCRYYSSTEDSSGAAGRTAASLVRRHRMGGGGEDGGDNDGSWRMEGMEAAG